MSAIEAPIRGGSGASSDGKLRVETGGYVDASAAAKLSVRDRGLGFHQKRVTRGEQEDFR
jgi:hypothetical protein